MDVNQINAKTRIKEQTNHLSTTKGTKGHETNKKDQQKYNILEVRPKAGFLLIFS